MNTLLYSVNFVAVALIVILLWGVVRSRRKYSSQPGPPSYPVIGHLLSIPLKDQAVIFGQWAKKYGARILATVSSRSSSLKVVVQATYWRWTRWENHLWYSVANKRLQICLRREVSSTVIGLSFQLSNCEFSVNDTSGVLICGNHLAFRFSYGWAKQIVWMRYGKEYHASRKLFQDKLSRPHCEVFQDRQIRHARIMAQNILRDPDDYSSHILRWVRRESRKSASDKLSATSHPSSQKSLTDTRWRPRPTLTLSAWKRLPRSSLKAVIHEAAK